MRYRRDGREEVTAANLVGLGANGMFNPFRLLKSGFTDPLLGRRLHEQDAFEATVYLDGVDNVQGSTSIAVLPPRARPLPVAA